MVSTSLLTVPPHCSLIIPPFLNKGLTGLGCKNEGTFSLYPCDFSFCSLEIGVLSKVNPVIRPLESIIALRGALFVLGTRAAFITPGWIYLDKGFHLLYNRPTVLVL